MMVGSPGSRALADVPAIMAGTLATLPIVTVHLGQRYFVRGLVSER
jgi:ABC-type glycerol-3-phosphate transport system permease component